MKDAFSVAQWCTWWGVLFTSPVLGATLQLEDEYLATSAWKGLRVTIQPTIEVLTPVRYPVYGFFLPVYSFCCMDDFSWGSNKKVLMNEEERFDESVIPLKKFGEYEAEACERGSHRSDETGYTKPQSQRQFVQSRPSTPQSFHQSMASDYYRDTNPMNNSTSNIRKPASHQSHRARIHV
ncbi:hypothetical protein EDD15DRAFT_2198090 [Pisolithus albus]|nr:hypothetical protein EDD15DRAFT_2198090 [Pisolithus albus]